MPGRTLSEQWISSNWKWNYRSGEMSIQNRRNCLYNKGMVEAKEPKSCTIFSAGLFKLCSMVCWYSLQGHQREFSCLGLELRPCFKQHRVTIIWLILNFSVRVCLIKYNFAAKRNDWTTDLVDILSLCPTSSAPYNGSVPTQIDTWQGKIVKLNLALIVKKHLARGTLTEYYSGDSCVI